MAGLSLVTAGPAHATHVTCGTIITEDTVLDSDVGPCSDFAIILGENDITLDLNGYTVFGSAGSGDNAGIYGPGTSGNTVKGGTVTGFDSGIYFEEGSGHTITQMNVVDNVGPLNGDGIFGEGIQFFLVTDSLITGNNVQRNGTFSGINMYDSSRNTVSGNNVADNNIAQRDATHLDPNIQQDIGIWVISLGSPTSTTGNIVERNSVTNNGLDGIQVSRFANGNTVRSNAVEDNGFGQVPGIRDGDGVANFGNSNVIEQNVSRDNAANGIRVVRSVNSAGTPVGGQNNTIRSNVTSGNGTGPNSVGTAFDLTDTNFTPPCDNNDWAFNTFVTFNQPCVTV